MYFAKKVEKGFWDVYLDGNLIATVYNVDSSDEAISLAVAFGK